MMWTIEEAIMTIRGLEPRLFAYHLALTGSVLYEGSSDKDLDIIVYPHRTGKKILKPELAIGYLKLTNLGQSEHEYDDKVVYKTKDTQGRIIDLFFLQ